MQKHAEEVLRATAQKKYRSSCASDTEDEVGHLRDGGEMAGRHRRRQQMLKQQDDDERRDAQIEAFLDQIEGETLGEMMNYLSAELQNSNAREHHQYHEEEEDKIYDEMTKLTRSTVDRYLDKIILDILYKSAQAVAEKETEHQLGSPEHSRSLLNLVEYSI